MKDTTPITYDLEFASGMTVAVRRLSARDQQDLSERTSRRQFNARGVEEVVSVPALWQREAPDFYIADIQHCTEEALAELNVLSDELTENGFTPTWEANGDGRQHIPYSKALARALWRCADAEKFGLNIMRVSREMLGLLARAKKKDSTSSDASFS